MRGAIWMGLAVLVSGCDPFVVEIDESSVCAAIPAQSFVKSARGMTAVLPLGVTLDEIPAADGVKGSVELVSVSIVPADGSDLGYVSGARVRVLPAPALGSTVGEIVAGSSASPQLSDDGALAIPGSDADIFPQIASGPAQLSIELDAPAGHALSADIGVCVRVKASAHYLE